MKNPLETVRKASERRTEARRAVSEATAELREAVLAAQETETMVDIAKAVGCSRPALYELVKNGKGS